MTVEFIISTLNRLQPLKCMLASLLAQTNSNWFATIVVDGKDLSTCPMFFEDYPENIKFIAAGKRYNDWGHTPREIGKQQSKADYIVMTNDDNYYMPIFVDELLKAASTKPGIIYCDMIHSHYDYGYFECRPAYNQIDMGAFATRIDLAKQIHMGTKFAADGKFIDDVKKMFLDEKIVKIDKVLFVHN